MNITSVGSTSFYDKAKKAEERHIKADAAAEAGEGKKADSFERTATGPKNMGIYRSRVGGRLSVSMMDAEQARLDSFRRMLQSMVAKQGQQSNLSLFGMDLYVTEADSAKAAASIAEGGEYSVDAVATRIMDMAKVLAGGDSTKIAGLREAVISGFKAAGVELGGKLPSICDDTYTECMKRFDAWEKELASPAE